MHTCRLQFSHQNNARVCPNEYIINPGSIYFYLLYNCHAYLTLTLILLKRSINERSFPNSCEICSVTQILKSGVSSYIAKYRQISILSLLYPSCLNLYSPTLKFQFYKVTWATKKIVLQTIS